VWAADVGQAVLPTTRITAFVARGHETTLQFIRRTAVDFLDFISVFDDGTGM